MDSPQADVVPAKKNQTPLIAAISVLVLCCCCAAVAIAGYYAYNVRSISNSDAVPFDQGIPDIGEAPSGGLGNDILRNDTWQYVAVAAMRRGCGQPVGADSAIEVLQEPQGGVWIEKWTVVCASGDSYAYEVEYVLDDTGATFHIRSLP